MDPELLKFLEAIKSRAGALAGGGVCLASSWIKGVLPCLDDPACAERFFGMGTRTAWEASIKASEQILTYRNDEMVALGGLVKLASDMAPREFGTSEKRSKEPTPGAIMDFDCVITTTKQDRDGDIMETEGADPDLKMPLLWQHIPMQPIGKLVQILNHSTKRLTGHYAIASTALGFDAAQLVEFGALRISHGFRPIKFEPLEPKKGEQVGPQGWHVLKFQIMEGSLVSVPSNEEAIITAFSRSKLHHPLMKAWAEGLWKACPVTVRSGWEGKGFDLAKCFEESNGITPKCGCGGKKPEGAAAGSEFKATTEGDKTTATITATGLPAAGAAGSLTKAVGKALASVNAVDSTLTLVFDKLAPATPSGSLALEKGRVSKGDVNKLYDAAYHCDAALAHAACPKACKTALEKSKENLSAVHSRHSDGSDEGDDDGKAASKGLRMTRKDLELLEEAVEHVEAARDHKDMPKLARTYADKAHKLALAVHGRHKGTAEDDEDDEEEEEKSADKVATKLLGRLLTGAKVSGGLAETLKSALDEAKPTEEDALAELFGIS